MMRRLAALALLLAPLPALAQDDAAANAAAARIAYAARDYEGARESALLAAGAGDAQSMTLLGLLYERGQGGPADELQARDWYERAAAENQPDALVALGRLGLDARANLTLTDARGYLSRAEALDARDARLPLARMLAEGMGGPPDVARARALFTREADAGSVAAMRDLAHLDLREDSPDAMVRARGMLDRAALAGDAEAAYEAGVLWAEDEAPESLERAAALLKQAAEAGHASAATLYAHALWDGAGVAEDRQDAVRWYGEAAMRGDAEGAFFYAVMLFAGAGVPADGERSYYWTLRSELADPAAETGYRERRDALRARIEDAMDDDVLEQIQDEARADHEEAAAFQTPAP